MQVITKIGAPFRVVSHDPKLSFAGTTGEKDCGDKWVVLRGEAVGYGDCRLAFRGEDAAHFPIGEIVVLTIERVRYMARGVPLHPMETREIDG